MKTPPPTPHFACRLVRLLGVGQRHVETCPTCQAYFAGTHELDSALRTQAAAEASLPPADLNRRIFEAVRAERAEPGQASGSLHWLGLAGVGAGALLAFVLLRPSPPQQPVDDLAAIDTKEILATAQSFKQYLWTSVEPSASVLAPDTEPLSREIVSVYNDGQSALSFLAANFLPPSVQEKISMEQPM